MACLQQAPSGAHAKARTNQYVSVSIEVLVALDSDIGVSPPDGVTRNTVVAVNVVVPLVFFSTTLNFSRAVLDVSGSNA